MERIAVAAQSVGQRLLRQCRNVEFEIRCALRRFGRRRGPRSPPKPPSPRVNIERFCVHNSVPSGQHRGFGFGFGLLRLNGWISLSAPARCTVPLEWSGRTIRDPGQIGHTPTARVYARGLVEALGWSLSPLAGGERVISPRPCELQCPIALVPSDPDEIVESPSMVSRCASWAASGVFVDRHRSVRSGADIASRRHATRSKITPPDICNPTCSYANSVAAAARQCDRSSASRRGRRSGIRCSRTQRRRPATPAVLNVGRESAGNCKRGVTRLGSTVDPPNAGGAVGAWVLAAVDVGGAVRIGLSSMRRVRLQTHSDDFGNGSADQTSRVAEAPEGLMA